MDINRPTTSPLIQEFTERIGWYIKLRWFASAGVLIGTLFGFFLLKLHLPVEKLLALGVAISVYNFAFWRYFLHVNKLSESKKEVVYRRFVIFQANLDWFVLSLIVHYSGGIQSPVLFFFVFHILLVSILLPLRNCYLLATIAFLMVTLVSLLEYFKVIPHISLDVFSSSQSFQPVSIFTTLFFFGATLYGTVFLTTSIIQAVRERERRLMMLQTDLQEEYNKLEESMMARSQFILTVTHELRAPLAAVQSMLKVIIEGYTGSISDKAEELIKRSERRIRFLLDLVNDLLDVSGKQMERTSSRRVEIDLKKIVADVIDGFQGEANAEGINLEVEIPDEPVILESNEKDLQNLLDNLLSNALKYTHSGGEVSLTVKSSEDEVNIEVADTGIGIPEEDIPKLFNEFFRTENAKQVAEHGTGLGLTIVKNIVDEHKGKISVESELGKGTQFLVSFPHT